MDVVVEIHRTSVGLGATGSSMPRDEGGGMRQAKSDAVETLGLAASRAKSSEAGPGNSRSAGFYFWFCSEGFPPDELAGIKHPPSP